MVSLYIFILLVLFIWITLTNADLHMENKVNFIGMGVVLSIIVFSSIHDILYRYLKRKTQTKKINL